MSKVNNPRILVFDIETSLAVTTYKTFTLYPYRLPHSSITQERYIHCASWSWLDEKRVYSVSTIDNGKHNDDRNVVKKLHSVLKGADATVTHNGKQFDHKILNGRILFHKLPPLHDMIKIDTLSIARKYFNFMSRRLDYLGQFLGVGQKIKTNIELWERCLAGDKKAIREMLLYNKQDVRLLKKVYAHMAPFADAIYNRNLVNPAQGFARQGLCPLCGSRHIRTNGVRYNRTTAVRRYQCNECGHNFKGKELVSRAALR